MALCRDFWHDGFSLCADIELRATFEQSYAKAAAAAQQCSLDQYLNATGAYYHALTGQTDRIPSIYAEHRLSSVNLLAPGKPMTEMIENQVYLAQGAYAKVIGRS